MFGPALRVELPFKQFQNEKEVRFPSGSMWVRLNSWDTFVAPVDQEYLSVMAKTGIDRDVNMYQAQGTIVALQDTKTYPVVKIEDLRVLPYTISIALDSY